MSRIVDCLRQNNLHKMEGEHERLPDPTVRSLPQTYRKRSTHGFVEVLKSVRCTCFTPLQ
jgi:hypothetical protein